MSVDTVDAADLLSYFFTKVRTDKRTQLIRSDGTACAWREVRAHVLKQSEHRCVTCGELATEVDHIWPRRWGGDMVLENLQALCGRCNKTKGASVDVVTAPSFYLLNVFSVAFNRMRDDLNGVGRDALGELTTRQMFGSVDAAEIREVLDHVRDGLTDALATVTEWAESVPRDEL